MSEGLLKESGEEAAASKLWAAYVSEAEKYDRALVESWKSNMQGILIFAGLFSASLTAFTIESYKTLVPDSGDSTVQLLNQISQQLAAAANGSSFPISPPTVFFPPTTSLVCNGLWFTSLGLSLTCALIATLLDEWARDFLHRADMRSAPVIRARIFSYLYYGLKRFNMHIVVDVIPLLLHASLFFFFAGLVAFLIPINITISAVAGGLLALLTAAYSALTVLPLWFLDCPYRTPISGAFWRLSGCFTALWSRYYKAANDTPRVSASFRMDTVVDAISQRATEISPARAARDYRALVWTVKSLADDVELEPFIEALPEVLWGLNRRRYGYDDHIRRLLRNPDLQLQSRIPNLLLSCNTGLLSPEASRRREISCYRALWAIATLQVSTPVSPSHLPIDFSELERHFNDLNDPASETDPERLHYSTSAAVSLQWSRFSAIRIRLAKLLQYLEQCQVDLHAGCSPDLMPVTSYLTSLMWSWSPTFPWSVTRRLWEDHHDRNLLTSREDYVPYPNISPELVREMTKFSRNTPHYIMFHFYDILGSLESPPYRWNETVAMIQLNDPEPSFRMQEELERVLDHVIYAHLDDFENQKADFWIDAIVRKLCNIWRPEQISDPRAIPSAVIHYLNARDLDDAIVLLLTVYNINLWSSVPRTLFEWPSVPKGRGHEYTTGTVGVEVVLTSLWRVLSLWPLSFAVSFANAPPPFVEICESALTAVTETGPSPVAFSVTSMIKALLIGSLEFGRRVSPFAHWLLPTDTPITTPHEPPADEMTLETARSLRPLLRSRIMEARIALLTDFLEGCSSDFSPYKAADTLRTIIVIGGQDPIYRGTIHETHQIRLARSIVRVSEFPDAELLAAVISNPIFDVYAGISRDRQAEVDDVGSPPPEWYAWLDSATARAEIMDTLTHAEELLPSAHSPLLTRIQEITQGLDSLHSEEYGESLSVVNARPTASPLSQFLSTGLVFR